MTYPEFKNQILAKLSDALAPECTVSIERAVKNNGTEYDGLSVTRPQSSVTPRLLLLPYYQEYQKGIPLERICADMLTLLQGEFGEESFSLEFFHDYRLVSRRLVPKLINYEKNREFLSGVPHLRYLDLAVIFLCLCDIPSDGFASVTVTDRHADGWGVDTMRLFRDALDAAPRLLPHTFENMWELLLHLDEDFTRFASDTEDSGEAPTMYILSNSQRINGASAILYPKLLASISERFGSDLLLLPSSIHEMLVLPVPVIENEAERLALANMIREVNDTQLRPEEILSDHAYCFRRPEQSLSIL